MIKLTSNIHIINMLVLLKTKILQTKFIQTIVI